MRYTFPLRLRNQSWLAAAMLFSACLLTVVFNWSLMRQRPLLAFTLLPGLAVGVHVQWQLIRHLEGNHRPGEENQLFPTLGAANWITLLRAGAIIWLAGLLPMTSVPNDGLPDALIWAPGLVYLAIALADLLDGLVARRHRRETQLGKRLDITTDAAGLLVASLVAVSLGRLPTIYLLVGLAYYVFIFGIRLRQKRALPLVTLQPRPYARIIAGFQMGLVGVALLPIFEPGFTFVAAYIFMVPLLAGFLRDWLVLSCRVVTDENQQTTMDQLAKVLVIKPVAWSLRLVVLVCGVTTVVMGTVYPAHPYSDLVSYLPSYLTLGSCCLLIGLGFMGRSAALVLALLLGSNLSPFNMSIPLMILFGAVATLMLTGSGAISLWAPEERLLYRCNGKKMTACNQTR
jgi:CDP-diacylglycerol--glycerol-3-phosphate 3-phosphatidyltransferase